MDYSVDKVGYNGASFKLEEGTIIKLYDYLDQALAAMYNHKRQRIVPPESKPNFGRFPFGETKLPPYELEFRREGKKSFSLGEININYFKGGKRPTPKEGVDYTASPLFSHISGKTTYESLTLFFDTSRVKKWMLKSTATRGDVIEANIESREEERDIFLEKLLNGHLV